MSGFGLYLAGLATLPAIIGAVGAVIWSTTRGLSIGCRACGYSTGEMRKTRRITAHIRWHWHKLTTGHHTRRWIKRQQWDERGRLVRPLR